MDIDSPIACSLFNDTDSLLHRNLNHINISQINHLSQNKKDLTSNLLKLANSSNSSTSTLSSSSTATLSSTSSNKRPLSNYFDSPTSLAADLSQNFHIKTSPTELFFNDDQFQSDSPSMNRKPLKAIPHISNASNISPKSLSSCSKSPNSHSDSTNNLLQSPKSPITRSKFKFPSQLLSRAVTQFEGSYKNSFNDSYFPSPIQELNTPTTSNNSTSTSHLNNFFDNHEESPNQVSNSPIQQRRNSKIKKSIRRTHSMYQSSKEINDSNSLTENNSILGKSKISSFKVEQDLLPRINEVELINIMDGKYNEFFDDFVIIDCRFGYEFDGGHIDNAINIPSIDLLEEKLLKDQGSILSKRLLIFHCEFSLKRGPHMASHLRKCDRLINSDNYPNLSYPDIVILDGGYKNFFDKYKTKCVPQNYIEMNDSKFRETCELEMSRVRRDIKSLTKSKSFHSYDHQRSNSVAITSFTRNLKILKRQKSSTFKISNLESKINQASYSPVSNSSPRSNHSSNSSSPRSSQHIGLEISSRIHQKSLSFSGLVNNKIYSSNSNLNLDPIPCPLRSFNNSMDGLSTTKNISNDISNFFEKPSINPLQNNLSSLLNSKKSNSGFKFPLPRKNSINNLNRALQSNRRPSVHNNNLNDFDISFSKANIELENSNSYTSKFTFNDSIIENH